MGRIGPVVVRSTEDRKVCGLNPTLRPNMNFSGHKKWISKAPLTKVWFGTLCLCKLDIPGCRMLAAHKTGSEIVSPGRPEH